MWWDYLLMGLSAAVGGCLGVFFSAYWVSTADDRKHRRIARREEDKEKRQGEIQAAAHEENLRYFEKLGRQDATRNRASQEHYVTGLDSRAAYRKGYYGT